MKAKVALLSNPQQLRDTFGLVLLSGAALVLGSMDQCTRGPSLTAILLTHLHTLV